MIINIYVAYLSALAMPAFSALYPIWLITEPAELAEPADGIGPISTIVAMSQWNGNIFNITETNT